MDVLDPRRAEQAFETAEILRRLANVVRLGTIHDTDGAAARARVRYDTDARGAPLLTDWLPWLTTRAGRDRTWWAPEPGEQVVVLAPGGELPEAVILPALYRDAHPAPAAEASKHVVLYGDRARIAYDRAAHHLSAVLPAGATAALTAPGGVSITGDVTVTGSITASGQVSDGRSSMQSMRDTYNRHASHPPGDM